MKVVVEKIDDINFIIRGTVDNDIMKEKANKFKAQSNTPSEDETDDKKYEEEGAAEVLKEFIDAGIKEASLNVDSILGQPGLKKYEQRKNAVYLEVALSTSPEINVDVDLSDIIPTFSKPQADPQAIEDKLTEFALKQAQFSAIATPRAVVNNDVTVIDFVGFIDGEVFEGGSAEKFNLKIGSESFIPGFEEQIIGMQYNEKKDVLVNFPDDYSATDLAGKEAKFIVTLHEIQEQIAQIPDDAFAKKILANPKATLVDLKAKFADQITSEDISELYMKELKPKIIKGLLSKFDFTLPNNIVEQEIDAKVQEKARSFSEEEHKLYVDNKDKFLELKESVREDARKSIKTSLIVEALAKKQGIEVSEHEVQAALTYQAMVTGQDAQELVKYYEENNLMLSAKMGLTEDKLFGVMLGFHQS